MKKTNWLEMVESKENEIFEKLVELYKETILIEGNMSGWKMELTMNEDGELFVSDPMSQNTMDGDVFNGAAIVIAKADFWNITDDQGVNEEDFASFLQEEYEGEWTKHPRYPEYLEECRDFLADEWSAEWAQQKIDDLKEDLKA